MKPDNKAGGSWLYALGLIPVVWFALLIAPSLSGGLSEIVNVLPAAMNHPFQIVWCEDSVKAVLIFIAAYASEHGEMAQYNRSYQANSACKEAIEQAISAHYAENRLDTEAAVKDVLEKFGTERVQFILANTIQRKNHDGRISQDNKAWAKTIPMPEDSGASRHCAYLVVDGVNPGLTDLFTRQARKTMQEQQKSSVLQKLKQEPPAHKPAAPKKQEPER